DSAPGPPGTPPGMTRMNTEIFFERLTGWAGAVFQRRFRCSFGSFPEVFQEVPELNPGAVDVGLHRAEWQVERGGDLLIASAFNVPKENAGAVFGPQLADGSLYRGAEFAGFHLFEGALLA